MIRFLFYALALLSTLASCDPSARRAPITDPSGFENAIGAAAVEALIEKTQGIYAQEEKTPFALVIGERLAAPSRPFLQRFRDGGHDFVEAAALDYDRVTKATVLKGSRQNPIVLQLVTLSQVSPTVHEVAVAWNRGSDLGRSLYRVEGAPDSGSLVVTEVPRPKDAPDSDES